MLKNQNAASNTSKIQHLAGKIWKIQTLLAGKIWKIQNLAGKIWKIPDPTSKTCKIQNLNRRFGKFQILKASLENTRSYQQNLENVKFWLQEWKIQHRTGKMWTISRSFQQITLTLIPELDLKCWFLH